MAVLQPPIVPTSDMATTSTITTSPFMLRVQDVETLLSSTGFNILRQHLAEHYTYDLCQTHNPTNHQTLPQWLLVRDALHAMLVPIVELYDKAILLSRATTGASQVEDLEYAFTGSARSSFQWLHSYLSNPTERAWCYTRGCPACVVEHSLDSESSVRILYVACLLSDVHYPFTIDGPTLPSFRFFLDFSLRVALENDPLFGTGFAEAVHVKAVTMRNGIEELIRQCLDLDGFLSGSVPATPVGEEGALTPMESSRAASPVLGPIIAGGAGGGVEGGDSRPSAGRAKLKLKRSKLARRQVAVKVEQEAWMEEVLRRCWDELEDGGGGGGGKRTVVGLDGDVAKIAALDDPAAAVAAVKADLAVQVREVLPGS